MTIQINPLHPEFAAEIVGLDIAAPVTQEVRETVEAAMARYAVIAIREQDHACDADQLRFARAFGPLELPPELGLSRQDRPLRIARELYDVSNLDENGELDDPDSLKRKFSKGNELFHTDSSFNDLPTKWSMLLAHELPPEGGNTEFVDTRAAYESLPDALRSQIDDLQVEHSLTHSRAKGGLTGTDTFERAFPTVVHPLVRTSASGRKALYIGGHARNVVGMNKEASDRLLDELVERATRPEHVYSHRWQPGDMVIWDNRCTMHRATTFDYANHRRDLRRATVNEYGEERVGSKA